MRRKKNKNGYTLVETMIVLAVTGAMFTTTVLLVSGQIQRYQFKDGVYNAKQKIQDVLNDTQVGYFAEQKNAPCPDYNINSVGDSECIYVGKKVSVNGSTLELTPLYVNDGQTPFSNPTHSLATQTITLPGGVDYTTVSGYVGQPTVYVLYNNYPDTLETIFTGGAQSVSSYNASGSTYTITTATATNSQKLCVINGSRKALLIIGTNGSTNVDIDYGAPGCP